MKFIDKILELVEEKAKILSLDSSHSALRVKLQRAVANMYAATLDSEGSYYNYPYIDDVFGDNTSGQVVYSKNGIYKMADYKSNGDGYVLSGEKTVKRSYVAESVSVEESEEYDISLEETSIVQESAMRSDGTIDIKLIGVGSGSSGHYTKESLQQAAQDKVFGKGLQMFLDHPTDEDRKRSGTGSVKNLAAVLESDADYHEAGADGPGLYAKAKVFSDFRDFIKERAKDIGISIAAGVKKAKGKTVDGLPVVEKFTHALSTDFVSAAGAGGKLLTVYESFRSTKGGTNPIQENKNVAKIEIEDSVLQQLQESAKQVPVLLARIDRLEESRQADSARNIVLEAIGNFQLSERGKQRVVFTVTDNLPMTAENKLDVAKLQENAKKAAQEEVDYLRESGISNFSVVRGMGGNRQQDQQENDKNLEAAQKSFDEDITLLVGGKKAS